MKLIMMYSLTEKWEKESKKIDTNHLIVLCELQGLYKSFCEDLEKLVKTKGNKNRIYEAYHAMQGKFTLFSRRYKSFIEKYAYVITTMNNYHCLSNLTVLSYDESGNRHPNLPEDYFFEYLTNHPEEREKIKSVALKLKELGISTIYLNETLDFSTFNYELGEYSTEFAFLNNIHINPTYLSNPISYTTTDSPYCICLSSIRYGSLKEIGKYNRKIYLNSLSFDPSILPDELTISTTMDVIHAKSKNQVKETNDIRDSIDLSITTSDLKNQFDILKNVISKIERAKNNDDLTSWLNEMQLIMAKLQSFGVTFESHVIETHPDITDKVMEEEKKLYLNRRFLDSIDFDEHKMK